MVALEKSILIKNMQRDQFQIYHIYDIGASALFEESREVYIPITILHFMEGSAQPGFEIHGRYKYTYDNGYKEGVHEGQAVRIHRYARVREIVGAGTVNDVGLKRSDVEKVHREKWP